MALNKILDRILELSQKGDLIVRLSDTHSLALLKNHHPYIQWVDDKLGGKIIYNHGYKPVEKEFKKFVRTHPHLFKDFEFKIEEALMGAL
jgi:hypothetical protein